MIELVAYSPSDGWSVVRDGDRYWLLKPPYRPEDRIPATIAEVRRAITLEDFEHAGDRFAGWGELSRHVAKRRVAEADPAEMQRARDAAQGILKRATVEQARRHLDRLEKGIAAGRHRGVEEALLCLLEAPAVCSSELYQETVRLLRKAKASRGLRAPSVGLSAWPVEDTVTVDAAGERIAKRGSVLFFHDGAA